MESKLITKGAHCVVEGGLLACREALRNLERISRVTLYSRLLLEAQIKDLEEGYAVTQWMRYNELVSKRKAATLESLL